MNTEESQNWLRNAAEAFAKTHNLVPSPRLYEEGLAGFWSVYGMVVLREAVNQTEGLHSREPAWGFLYVALERAFGHAEAAVVALITGSFATAEAVARVTAESAINVRYILAGHPFERVFDYFSDYISSEREKVRKWRNALSGMNEDERNICLSKIQEKTQALDGYETKLRQVAEKIHPPVDGQPVVYQAQRWPNAFERFQAVGDELAYRTVYSALSSQVHNDAEDLLNRFILDVYQDAELIKKQASVNENFARMATYNAIAMALEAAQAFALHMAMNHAYEEFSLGKEDMETASFVVASQIGGGTSITGEI